MPVVSRPAEAETTWPYRAQGSFEGTGGLRVSRDAQGLRQGRALDNVVQWGFVNRTYLR